jgi:hypothetical protein
LKSNSQYPTPLCYCTCRLPQFTLPSLPGLCVLSPALLCLFTCSCGYPMGVSTVPRSRLLLLTLPTHLTPLHHSSGEILSLCAVSASATVLLMCRASCRSIRIGAYGVAALSTSQWVSESALARLTQVGAECVGDRAISTTAGTLVCVLQSSRAARRAGSPCDPSNTLACERIACRLAKLISPLALSMSTRDPNRRTRVRTRRCSSTKPAGSERYTMCASMVY